MKMTQVAAVVLAATMAQGAAGGELKARAVITKNRELVFYYDTLEHYGEGYRYEVPNGTTRMMDVGWNNAWDSYDRVVFTEDFAACGIQYDTAYWFNFKAPMTEIELPVCVTVIGSCTFASSPKLEAVTIPESVVEVKECAFYPCNGLKSITFAAKKPPVFAEKSIKGAATGCVIHLPAGADRKEWESALGENLSRVTLDIPAPSREGLVILFR